MNFRCWRCVSRRHWHSIHTLQNLATLKFQHQIIDQHCFHAFGFRRRTTSRRRTINACNFGNVYLFCGLSTSTHDLSFAVPTLQEFLWEKHDHYLHLGQCLEGHHGSLGEVCIVNNSICHWYACTLHKWHANLMSECV